MDAQQLLDGLPDLVMMIGPSGGIEYLNATVERVLGWQPSEWIGRSILDIVHPDDVAGVMSSISALQGHELGTPIEMRVIDVDGEWHWMEVIGANPRDDALSGLVCVARDITQRRMWEVAGGDVARFQQVVQHAAAITLLVDEAGVVASVNAAFARLLGHDPSVVVGRPLDDFITPHHRGRWVESVRRLVNGRRGSAVELLMTRSVGGDPRPIRFELINLLDDPVVGGIVVSGHDLTDLQQARDDLEHLASHDALTGLGNRSLLLEGIEQSLMVGASIAVVFIDLDRFKPVNDLYGHEAGDAVLCQVAARLLRVVRPADLVARVGGDEFVVLAKDITTALAARQLADRIEAELNEPFTIDDATVRVGASVGVSVSDVDSTVVSLLSDADVQMYDSKLRRRGLPVRPMPDRRRGAIERRRLAEDLAVGIERGEVVAHLQPIVDLSNGALVSVEALARWNHPELGLLQPADFIDLVEDAALDVPFGDAVLSSAAATMARLHGLGVRPTLAINLSVGQLSHRGLTQRIKDAVGEHGLTMQDLVVEITERSTLTRTAAVGASSPEATLHALDAEGAGLSLDDFGTGHSSLTHVRRYPLRSIKIDHTFVAGMSSHPEDLAVVDVVIGLGRALDLDVIAEGIESTEQYQQLLSLGCGFGQGFLISPALDPDAFVGWISGRA